MNKYQAELKEYSMLKSTKIIDAHTHMGDVYGTCLSVHDVEGCIKIMDEQNIEWLFCSPHADLFSPLSVNSEIVEILKFYSKRIKGYYGFNPNYESEYSKEIKNVPKDKRFIGYKLLPEYHRTPLSAKAYQTLFDVADESSLLILIHTWGGSPYNSPKEIELLLKRYKKLKIIMGHSAPGEADAAIKLAADYENAYLDLCDIHRHSGMVQKMVEGAGSKKVLFGTDMPWYDPSYCLGSVIYSDISEESMSDILYNNAKKLLDINDRR